MNVEENLKMEKLEEFVEDGRKINMSNKNSN